MEKPVLKPTREEFLSYVIVQHGGEANMLSQAAREMVGIEDEKYRYILLNYSKLSKEYNLTVDSEEVIARM